MEIASKSSVHFLKHSIAVAREQSVTPPVPAEPSIATISSRKSKKNVASEIPAIDIYNDPLFNKDGTRNTKIPFDLFVIRKKEEERQQNKKRVIVSKITKNDNNTFKEALRHLKREQARRNSLRTKFLKSLAKSREFDKPVKKEENKKLIEEKYPCPLNCGVKPDRKKSRSRSRSRKRSDSKGLISKGLEVRRIRPIIKIPPIKVKTWKPPADAAKQPKEKMSRYPNIVIPPFKTRKWVPRSAKPKPKINIEYPELKMRKRPWTPKSDKKIKKKVFRVSKLHYPMVPSSLGKTWHSFKFITPKMQILSGNFSQYSKKFSFTTNGKQSAFISAIALSTSSLYPMKQWKSCLLDEIISYGDINFRRHLNRLKHKSVVKPSDVYHKIYLKHAKVLIEIGEATIKGIYDPDNAVDIKQHIMDMLDKFPALMILYHGQTSAVWKEDNAFYNFNSEDTNEKGKSVEKCRGTCCVMRSTSLDVIIEYLIDTFRVVKHLYEIFSFRVNQKIMIEDLEKPQSRLDDEFNKKDCESQLTVIESQEPQKNVQKTGLAAVLFRHQSEPTFGDNFLHSNLPDHFFIICAEYLTRDAKNRAPFVSSTAIVMLQICKSSLWMSATLERIFQIGHKVYLENVEKILLEREKDQMERLKAMEPDEISVNLEVPENSEDEEDDEDDEDEEDQPLTKEQIREMRRERLAKPRREFKVRPDIPITELRPVLSIGKLKYEISVETLNIGKISSRSTEELSLESGIINLFKHYDYGLIIGPDVVAVWHENNRFFMFDPNICKGFNRYKEYDHEPFNSCLNSFQSISSLVQLYIDNLPKSQKNSIYKICKIESRDYAEKPLNWQEFKAISHSKWILNGTISESSEEFNEANRNNQSTCMSVVALAKSREIGIFTWTSDTIDEILRIGDEFYAGCVLNLKEAEKFESPHLTLSEIGSELMLDKVVVDFSYEESVVYGRLHHRDGFFVTLVDGLRMFFKNEDLGVLTACGISVAVLKFHDGFFIFDSHSRDEHGRNFNTVDPINACTVKGTACMLRFITIEDLANHLIGNLETSESSFYTIDKVDVSVRSSDAPCLYNYKAFGDDEYGAILKAFEDFHEDCDEFRCGQHEKTLCNILSCLCYASIYNPRVWASNEINEILKIGWKFLCKASKDFDNFWDTMKNIEVCGMKLCAEVKEEQCGIFMVIQRLLSSSLNKAEEVLEEQTDISEINKSISENGKSDEHLKNLDQAKQYRSSTFTNLSNHGDQPTLMDVLKSVDKNLKIQAILTSSLFTIGIFKINKFYYVFDPKASMNGMLVRKRLENFINSQLIMENDMLVEKLKEFDEMKRLSMEEKMEELIFGRPVIFGHVIAKPSLHEIILNSSYGALDGDGPISICEKGAAYVAWFTTLELLHQHVINKIPERFVNEPFKLLCLDLSKESQEIFEPEKWHSFEKIEDTQWIVRGTFSQNDAQFPATHRNNQDIANCIIALAFKSFCNYEDWNSMVLDVILKFGDRLYKKSLAKKAKIQSIHTSDLKLRFSDMEVPIFIRPYVITFSEELLTKDFIIKASDSIPLGHFKSIVQSFLEVENFTGILSSKMYFVAIWRCDDGAFMMFDPHDIGPDGCKKLTGLSSLQRFTNTTTLVETFWNNVKDIDGLNEFQLHRIDLNLSHFKDGEDDVFDSIDQDLAGVVSSPKIIASTTASINTNKIEMTICYAVAAHCLCQALDSEFYTSDMIDRIILFGNELVCECSTSDEVCFKDFNLSKHSSCPDEINWNFQLNDTFTTIQMDIFRRGVVSKQPCPLPNLIFVLEEFFDFHCSGVLVTSEFIAAIWRDNEQYFIFYSCPIDKYGVRSGNENGSAGCVVFKTVHELFTNIVRNTSQSNVPFELRICSIKLVDEVEDANKKMSIKKANKKFKSVLREEIIMPAVSFRDIEVKQGSMLEMECPKKKEFKSMIENLRKRKACEKGFIKFSRGGFICGKLSKDSRSISEVLRIYHAPAICLCSAAMHSIVNMNCWSGDVIDCVILSGNSLYVESSILCGSSKVAITSIVSPLLIDRHEIQAKAESCLDIAFEDFKINYLLPVFYELLSCYNACYLSQLMNFWTIAKAENFYFLFDPRGIEVPGKKMSQLHATLYRFDSLEMLMEQMEDCVSCIGATEGFSIGGILTKVMSRPSSKDEKRYSAMRKKKLVKCPVYKESKPILNIRIQPPVPEQNVCEDELILC